jgi:DNA primase
MKTCQDIKSAAIIGALIHYTETLLDICFKHIKKDRYSAPCPFHTDTKGSFMVYVNKDDEVRFHCFGACKGEWDIYDSIMLRKKNRFFAAQQVWAKHLGVEDFSPYAGNSTCISDPDEIQEPDDPVGFVNAMKIDPKRVVVLEAAADFYHNLLMSNQYRFKYILDYLARRGVGKDAIKKFNIGYTPPYSDERHQGRALIDSFLPRFEKDNETFKAFTDGGQIKRAGLLPWRSG